jgi:hypothetical protein
MLALGMACDQATNPQALKIMGNQIPDQSCAVSAEGGGGAAQFLLGGALDLALTTEWHANLLLRNDLPRGSELTGFEVASGRLDSNALTVTHVELSYAISDEVLQCREVGNGCLDTDPETDPSLFVDAATIYEPQGLALGAFPADKGSGGVILEPGGTGMLAGIPLVTHNRGLILRQLPIIQSRQRVRMIVTVRVYAQMQDASGGSNGTVLRTPPLAFEVLLCWRCLVIDSAPIGEAENPALHEGLSEEQTKVPCTVGNDDQLHNPVCSLKYGTGSSNCELNRCLGRGNKPVCDFDLPLLLP